MTLSKLAHKLFKNKRLGWVLYQSVYYRIGYDEGWENGACAAFLKLKEDGIITDEQHFEYLKGWYL